ncbi:MAG: hypothetical protein WBB02_10360 [Saprospiraceae bacterium]
MVAENYGPRFQSQESKFPRLQSGEICPGFSSMGMLQKILVLGFNLREVKPKTSVWGNLPWTFINGMVAENYGPRFQSQESKNPRLQSGELKEALGLKVNQ